MRPTENAKALFLEHLYACPRNSCGQAALDANPKAGKFFAPLTGANRYAILHRIGVVKRRETRMRKIAEFVAMLERGETIHG
jgi:uncharacterized protein YdeI (YjbR/CyaY-like superfamily)